MRAFLTRIDRAQLIAFRRAVEGLAMNSGPDVRAEKQGLSAGSGTALRR